MLKISGEGFCQRGGFGIDRGELDRVAGEIQAVAALGVQVAVVVGGGNFMRGASFANELGIDLPTADYLTGMPHLAENLEAGLEAMGVDVTRAEEDLL